MSVAALITEASQINEMIGWGHFVAKSEKTDLLVIVLQKSKSEPQWVEWDSSKQKDGVPGLATKIANKLKVYKREAEVAEQVKDEPGDAVPQSSGQPASGNQSPAEPVSGQESSSDRSSDERESDDGGPDDRGPEECKTPIAGDEESELNAQIKILKSPKPEWSLVEEVESLDIRLLLLPEMSIAKSETESTSWLQNLYLRAPCETIQVDSIHSRLRQNLKVLVTTTGQSSDRVALRRALKIAQHSGGEVIATYFEPDIDDYAIDVGKKILKSIVGNAVGASDCIRQQAVVADTFSDGLKYFDLTEFDVVICGTQNVRESDRFLKNSVLKDAKENSDLLSVRRPIPLASRFVFKLQQVIERFVPQLTREQRIDLVQRVQSSSEWNFDFCIMICLSTMIAALGLIQDSVAVVIGAMLVAPLMTPIVGTGLGLAQTNVKLVRTSLGTVLRGFATAFFIGALAGFILKPEESTQMIARGSPNFLDLIVALVSGIAAAYAMGRPNLLPALPGVAIAAALVPPLATSGVAIAVLDYRLSYGALLLFATNIVAIILGTTITFWLVGIRRTKSNEKSRIWPLWVFLFFILLTIGLTIMMSLNGNKL